MSQTENKNLLKQYDEQSILMSSISIAKEKELSELKKLLDDITYDLNLKLLNKDNI